MVNQLDLLCSEYPKIERGLRVATCNMETPDFNKLVNDVTSTKESSDTGLSKALYKPLSVRSVKRIESELNVKTDNGFKRRGNS
jgi:hypothetical protein